MKILQALLATPVAAFLPTADVLVQSRPDHCSAPVLSSGCTAITGKAESPISSDQLQAALDATQQFAPSAAEFLEFVELADAQCESLCLALTAHYAEVLPWKADVGCSEASGHVRCDIDLAPDTFKTAFPEDSQEHVHTESGNTRARQRVPALSTRLNKAGRAFLRLFRSYAFAEISVEVKEGHKPPPMEGTQSSNLEESIAAHSVVSAEPAFLQRVTTSRAWSLACAHHSEFREASGLCGSNAGTGVLLQLASHAAEHGLPHADFVRPASFVESARCLESCAHPAVDGLKVHVEGCDACATPRIAARTRGIKPKRPSKVSDWQRDVAKVNLKAQAYVARVLKGLKKGMFEQEMDLWFGTTVVDDKGAKYRKDKVLSVLNSLEAMMDNVDYIYPGKECESSTYAYVYPNSGSKTFTKSGKYKFYLCDVYMKVDLGEKIETLTHEGSHHRTAYTDDVDYNGGTAYGRSTCKSLAKHDRGRHAALENADSYCYFINDAAQASDDD